MERRETILFYLLGVVGLVVVSILSTNQIERVEIQPLPTSTPTITITPQPTATSPHPPLVGNSLIISGTVYASNFATPLSRMGCATIPQGITFGYLPDTATLAHLTGDTLTISGTVYAWNFMSVLPDVLIEVWRATPESRYDRFPPFILLTQVRTDAAGQYEFTTAKPDYIINYYNYRHGGEFLPIYFHYRLSYQGTVLHP